MEPLSLEASWSPAGPEDLPRRVGRKWKSLAEPHLRQGRPASPMELDLSFRELDL
jgi:hypothetical protein